MKKKERKLTAREQRRKEKFDAVCEEMETKGYTKTELTVGVVAANILAFFVMAPFMALVLWVFYRVVPRGDVLFTIRDCIVLFPLMIGFIVIHELIHGLTWGSFAKNHFNSVDFGVIWSMLTPYCTCTEPMKRWQYVLGCLMPTLVLGFGLTATACFIHSLFWILVAEIMIWSGGCDFLICYKILLHRSRGKESCYYDHPYKCGVVVYEKK